MNAGMPTFLPLPPPSSQNECDGRVPRYPPTVAAQSSMEPTLLSAKYLTAEGHHSQLVITATGGVPSGQSLTPQAFPSPTLYTSRRYNRQQPNIYTNESTNSPEMPAGLHRDRFQQPTPRFPDSGTLEVPDHVNLGPQRPSPGQRISSVGSCTSGSGRLSPVCHGLHEPQLRRRQSPEGRNHGSHASHDSRLPASRFAPRQPPASKPAVASAGHSSEPHEVFQIGNPGQLYRPPMAAYSANKEPRRHAGSDNPQVHLHVSRDFPGLYARQSPKSIQREFQSLSRIANRQMSEYCQRSPNAVETHQLSPVGPPMLSPNDHGRLETAVNSAQFVQRAPSPRILGQEERPGYSALSAGGVGSHGPTTPYGRSEEYRYLTLVSVDNDQYPVHGKQCTAEPGDPRRPNDQNYPYLSPTKRQLDHDQPLDLSVKKRKTSHSDSESDDDVIVIGVQGPLIKRAIPKPAMAGQIFHQRGQNTWIFPQIPENGTWKDPETCPKKRTDRSSYKAPTTSNRHRQSQPQLDKCLTLTDLDPDKLFQQIAWTSSKNDQFPNTNSDGRNNGEPTNFQAGGRLTNGASFFQKRVGEGTKEIPPVRCQEKAEKYQGFTRRYCPSNTDLARLANSMLHSKDVSPLPILQHVSPSMSCEGNFIPRIYNKEHIENIVEASIRNESRTQSEPIGTMNTSDPLPRRNNEYEEKLEMASIQIAQKPHHNQGEQLSDVLNKVSVTHREQTARWDIAEKQMRLEQNTLQTRSSERKDQSCPSQMQDEKTASLQQDSISSYREWQSWRNGSSRLTVAEPPIRLSTLMEPVSVTRHRNDGLFGNQVPESKQDGPVNLSDNVLDEKREQTREQMTDNRKREQPFRSKKEYIFAHLQQENADVMNWYTQGQMTPKKEPLSHFREAMAIQTPTTHPNVLNNNCDKFKVLDEKCPLETGLSIPREFTPSPLAYRQTRRNAEDTEQSKTKTKIKKEDEWTNSANREYFPRCSSLDCSNVRRIPIANVQPIPKVKAADPAHTSCINSSTESDNHQLSAQINKPEIVADTNQQMRKTFNPGPRIATKLSHQLEFVKFITAKGNRSTQTGPGRRRLVPNGFYRTPTPSHLPGQNEDISYDKGGRATVRKKLAFHYSTPKGRQKLFSLEPDAISPPTDEHRTPDEAHYLKSSKLAPSLGLKKRAGRPSKNEKTGNRTTQTRYKEDRPRKYGRNSKVVSATKSRQPHGKLKASDGSGIDGIVLPSNGENYVKTKRKAKVQNEKSSKGLKPCKQYPKRQQGRRPTRSTKLRRTLRSTSNLNSYNKNLAYEVELQKEEERKLRRKENKHAQIRKRLQHLGTVDDVGAEGQLFVDTVPPDSLTENVAVSSVRCNGNSTPNSTKQRYVRRYRRRRKAEYVDIKKRSKYKMKQRRRQLKGDSEESGYIQRGDSARLACEFDLVDAGVHIAQPGNDIRACDKDVAVTSADLTSTADARRLVVCKKTGETTLHKAARLGYKDVVLAMMPCENMDVNVRDNAGYTPLHESCAGGNLQIALWLIQRGADVNAKAFDGTRPLHDAVVNNRVEIVRLLLAHGADPTIANYSGNTPQKLARSARMTSFLLGYLSDINGCDYQEIQWEFEGPWKRGGKYQPEIDLLADAPVDEEIDQKMDADLADEIVFEFSARPPLPAFNVCAEQDRGPRNYHRVKDVADLLDMTADDFTLLNSDLALAEISKDAMLCPQPESVSLQQLTQGGANNELLVEIEDSLRQMLDISPETLTSYEPTMAPSVAVSETDDIEPSGIKGAFRFDSEMQGDSELKDLNKIQQRDCIQEKELCSAGAKNPETTKEQRQLFPIVAMHGAETGDLDKKADCPSLPSVTQSSAVVFSPPRIASVKDQYNAAVRLMKGGPLVIPSNNCVLKYNIPISEVAHSLKVMTLVESEATSLNVKLDKSTSLDGLYTRCFGHVNKPGCRKVNIDNVTKDNIIHPAHFVCMPSIPSGPKSVSDVYSTVSGDSTPLTSGVIQDKQAEPVERTSCIKNEPLEVNLKRPQLENYSLQNGEDSGEKLEPSIVGTMMQEKNTVPDFKDTGGEYSSRKHVHKFQSATYSNFGTAWSKNTDGNVSIGFNCKSSSSPKLQFQAAADRAINYIWSKSKERNETNSSERQEDLEGPTGRLFGTLWRDQGSRSRIPPDETALDGGDPSLPILEKLNMEDAPSFPACEMVFDDRQMPKLTLFA